MVEAYNFFEGSQTDINRRLLRKIEELEEKNTELESSVGELEEKNTALEARVEELESPSETPTGD